MDYCKVDTRLTGIIVYLEFAPLKVSGSNSLSITFYVESVYIEQKNYGRPHVGGEIDILKLLNLLVRYRVFKKENCERLVDERRERENE
jgi:hypothetical protein